MFFVAHLLGMQLLAWAFGITVTVVLLDSATGLVRDHPPMAWRLAGLGVGPLTWLSLLGFVVAGETSWFSLALLLPFCLIASLWSWSWYRRESASHRRGRGREALVIGLLTLLFVSLEQSVGLGSPVLALAASGGSAALVGGLGTLLLGATLGRGQDVVATGANPKGIPAQVVATGLGITLLATVDTGFNLLLRGDVGITGQPWVVWVACSLVLPLLFLAAGRRLRPRWQAPLWATCFSTVLVGQLVLQAAIYMA